MFYPRQTSPTLSSASAAHHKFSPPTFTSFNWLPSSICSAHQLVEHNVDDLRNQSPCSPSSSGHDSCSNYSVSTCAGTVHFHSIRYKMYFFTSTPGISRPICTDCFVFFFLFNLSYRVSYAEQLGNSSKQEMDPSIACLFSVDISLFPRRRKASVV
jgi:hypothetical protein